LRKHLEEDLNEQEEKQQQRLLAYKPITNVSNQLFKMLAVDCSKYVSL